MKRSRTLGLAFAVVAMLSLLSVAQAQTLQLPYFCGFEDAAENSQWVLNAGNTGVIQNKWYISDAEVYSGDSALLISCDAGATATYGNSGAGGIVAYRVFTLPAGTYDFSFTYYVGGEGTVDGLYACKLDASQTSNSSPISLPGWVNSSAMTISSKKIQNLTGGWMVATQQIVSTGAAMKIAFVWSNNGSVQVPPGACIDNVQIARTTCAKPTNINATVNNGNVVVTWAGNASSYDLQYRAYGDPHVYTVTGIVGNSYTINGLGEGLYDFLVRSNCPNDTSIWAVVQNIIVYDPAGHCIDFINFTAPGTTCYYGTYTNPRQNTGVVDNGPSQMSSRHTVNSTPGQTDPRTGDGLPLIPRGEVMSVRLGNWNNGSQAESIEYTYTVPANANVIMILKYAVVFENPNHATPPEFNMQINNLQGQSIGACTQATFVCEASTLDNTWHNETQGDIWWKEWTQVGFNLSQYAGQTLKVSFTTKDCNQSGHYGYAYYTLNCTEAQITGLSCGDALEAAVKAPDGFNYEWSLKSDRNQTVVSTSQNFSVTGTDTATYVCKVINKTNPGCFFLLEASLLPRSPNAQFTPQWVPANCQNAVTFQNTSSVVTIRGVTSEKPEYYEWYVVDSLNNDTILNGSGQESPTLAFPNEGGDYIVELVAAISGGKCQDTLHMLYHVPEIHEVHDTIYEEICGGQVYVFNGQKLSTAGDYDFLGKVVGGCDSTVHLVLSVVNKIEADVYDTICDGQSYTFNGNTFSKPGDYKAKSTSQAGCDSVTTLHLFVYDPVTFTYSSVDETGAPNTGSIILNGMQPGWTYEINGVDSGRLDSLASGHYLVKVRNAFGCESAVQDIELKRVCVDARFPRVPEFCADDETGDVPVNVIRGEATTYNVRYSAEAKAQGFVDVDSLPVDTALNMITLTLPNAQGDSGSVTRYPKPDKYKVVIEFNDVICGPTSVNLEFWILYASSVIEQKWDDVLAVLNEKYNDPYNGGYKFVEFQWFKNGQLMPGEIGSYLYLGLDGSIFNYQAQDQYSVQLKRLGETYSIMSCPMTPVQRQRDQGYITLCSACMMLQMPGANIELDNIDSDGTATWYSVTGQMVGRYAINPMSHTIQAPSVSGVYVLEVVSGTERQSFKMLIKE